MLNSCPLYLGTTFLPEFQGMVDRSYDNNSFSIFAQENTVLTMLNTTCDHMKTSGDSCRCGDPFFLWSLVRFNCARNSGVEHVNRPEGFDMNTEGLGALSRILHAMWMHYFISIRSPLVPYLMRVPFLGQVWVLRVPR